MRELVGALLLAAAAANLAKLGVGRQVAPAEVVALDITILPSGAGLPVGKGTAREGRALYATRCAVCHGARGEGKGDYPPLTGGRGSLATDAPLPAVGAYWPYATTVWDYVHRGMPYDHPGILPPDEVYAITAFVLHLNGIVGEDDVLNETTLPKVQMPNRNGFVVDPRPDVDARRQRKPE